MSGTVKVKLSEEETDIGSFADFWDPRFPLRVRPVPVFVARFDRN